MDNITILDLFLMLVASTGKKRQANIDVLRSLYERTHSYYVVSFSASLALAGGIVGALIGLLAQREASNEVVAVAVIIGLVVALILMVIHATRLNRLQRNYLDIIQVYNLLARFF